MKDITIREKAAIQLYLSQDGKISPSELYRVAYSESLEKVNALKDLPACANRWFHGKKVQDYLLTEKLKQEDKRKTERELIEAEILGRVQESNPDANITNMNGVVDYSNPDNRRKLYTAIINKSVDDPKTQLDAAKMFEQIQKDNREAASTHQKHVRYYLPLRCESCVLYRKAKEAREKHI